MNHWLLGHSFHLSGVSADSGSTLGLGVVRSKSDALLWFVPTTIHIFCGAIAGRVIL